MSAVMIARGKTEGGNTTIEWAQRPAQNVIEYETIGDTRLALIEHGDACVATMTHTIAYGSREQVEAFYHAWAESLRVDSEDCPLGLDI